MWLDLWAVEFRNAFIFFVDVRSPWFFSMIDNEQAEFFVLIMTLICLGFPFKYFSTRSALYLPINKPLRFYAIVLFFSRGNVSNVIYKWSENISKLSLTFFLVSAATSAILHSRIVTTCLSATTKISVTPFFSLVRTGNKSLISEVLFL